MTVNSHQSTARYFSLRVLDEAHTLSQWRHDFRPDFLRIAKNIQKFDNKRQQNSSIRWGFVTATATLKVIEDLENAVKQLDGLCSGSLKRLPPPATPEAYLQEIGRLARTPGEQGSAYLFWHSDDFNWIFQQQGRSQISLKGLRDCWDVIRPLVRNNNEEAWISCLDLAKPLGLEELEDLEILETPSLGTLTFFAARSYRTLGK